VGRAFFHACQRIRGKFILHRHRIQKCYNRTATVIYPPVDVDRFSISAKRDNYFITISRLVPYKRVDLIIQAFNQLDLPLVIVGDGLREKISKKCPIKTFHFLAIYLRVKWTNILKKPRVYFLR